MIIKCVYRESSLRILFLPCCGYGFYVRKFIVSVYVFIVRVGRREGGLMTISRELASKMDSIRLIQSTVRQYI